MDTTNILIYAVKQTRENMLSSTIDEKQKEAYEKRIGDDIAQLKHLGVHVKLSKDLSFLGFAITNF